MLDLNAIDAALSETIFFGNLHHAPITDSTNSDAMAGARQGEPHGSVWLAEEQTAGRGRGNHRWHSAAGQGLYVSILLRPKFSVARFPLLPLVAGLAASEAIRTTANLAVDLRWPNDLLIGPRKTAGILVEAALAFAVIGIGINVHQHQFPEGLDTPATSLDREAGTSIPRQALLINLLRALERESNALSDSASAAQIPSRIAKASSWITGRRVEVHGPQACSGTTAGLDENGFLLVQTSTGLATIQTGGIRAAAASSSTMD